MIVYGSTLSPFVRKVMAYLAEKGLSAELKPSDMGQGGPDFDEASPFAKMPALRDPRADHGRDFVISDSTAIITYLEAKHPQPEMIPADPIARADDLVRGIRRHDGRGDGQQGVLQPPGRAEVPEGAGR